MLATCVDKPLAARVFFSAFMHCALTVSRIPCLRSDRTQLDSAIEKRPVRFLHCAKVHSHLHFAPLVFGQRGHQRLRWGEKMFTTVGHIAHHAGHQDRSAQVHHSGAGDQ